MTAPKLAMPGVRDRFGCDEGEDPARRGGVVLQPQAQQEGRSENGCATAAAGARGEQQSRCSNSSPRQAGLASSIMQPLPLASRYVPGAARHDSPSPTMSSTLGSSWIRRFLPPVGALGQEGIRTAKGGAGGGESGSQPSYPLLLASGSNEQAREEEEVIEIAKHRRGLDSCKETFGRVRGNGEDVMQKGKGHLEREKERESRQQETTASQHDLGENGVGASLWEVSTSLPSHHRPPVAYSVDGRSRTWQCEGGNHRTVLSSHRGGESHANGTFGTIVIGFGPLRVGVKSPTTGDSRVVGGNGPKLQGDVPVATAAGAQPDAQRVSKSASVLPDRKPSGTQAMASQTGTKSTPLSKSELLDDQSSGRPFRAVEFGGAWGFPTPKKQKVEPDVGDNRPFKVPPTKGTRDTTTAARGGGLKPAEPIPQLNPFGEGGFKHRMETGHHVKFWDPDNRAERMKTGSGKFSEGFVSSYPPATLGNMGRKEDGRQAAENHLHGHAGEDASARPNSGAGLFPTGVENRKMKEVVVGCGFSRRGHTDMGPHQHQHQHSPDTPPYSSHHPFQGDMGIGKVGHPLPFSPYSSFPGEDSSGEDAKKARLTKLFSALKAYEEGVDGRGAAPSEQQQAPWTSIFSAFKGNDNHPEPAYSSSLTPSLPADVHLRLQDGSATRPFEVPKVNGVHNETGGGGGGRRNDDHLLASPESRTRFDNQGQSSHFSSSPWPDDEGHVPHDDAGSRPHISQATGSGPYHSQASRVANPRSSGDSRGKYMDAYRYDTGGGDREGFDTFARSRESSGEPDFGKFPVSQVEEKGHHMSNKGNQAHVSATPPVKHSRMPPMSGFKDDTSDSSPPSFPPDYNSSEIGSPLLPHGIVDEHLLSSAGKFKNVEVDSNLEGSRVPRMQKGYRKEAIEFLQKRPRDSEVYGDPKDDSAFPGKGPNCQRTGPYTVRGFNPEKGSKVSRPNEGLESGQRHHKLQISDEAIREGGISGSSNRACYGSSDLGSQMAGSVMPSSWLKRWLPPSSGNVAKSQSGFARPKDYPRSGLISKPSGCNGNFNSIRGFPDDRSTQPKSAEEAAARGNEREREHGTKARLGGVKDISRKRGVNGLPPHPVPSAAAMALVGVATRKVGPFPQQRKGSFAMWSPVHLQTPHQAPAEGQQSSRSPELSL